MNDNLEERKESLPPDVLPGCASESACREITIVRLTFSILPQEVTNDDLMKKEIRNPQYVPPYEANNERKKRYPNSMFNLTIHVQSIIVMVRPGTPVNK
jgi:hypothetical protein